MASFGKGAIFFILFFLWCAYIIVGIFVFAHAEGKMERENHEQVEGRNTSSLKAATMEKHNMTAAEFEALAEKIRETHDDSYDERRWSYGDSFWFVISLLTTIGKNGETLF